ncbi:MAG: hypothetical protein ACR2G4_07440 [Pyrinomonadaceae bacterium]
MKKKTIVLTLSIMVLGVGTFALSNKVKLVTDAIALNTKKGDDSAQSASQYVPDPVPAQQQDTPQQHRALTREQAEHIPEEVVYGILFRQITAMKRAAVRRERQGQDGSSLRNHVKKEAKLKDEQARVVDRIALETEQEIAHTDKQAKKIINAIRVRYPKGRLKDDESLPLPPPELHTLNEQRKNIILQARERLRTALGEAEFKRFDDFTKEKIARKIKKLDAEPTNLISSGLPQEPKK